MARQSITIEVEDLILIESGTYGDQFLRPYVTELSGGIVDRISERYHKSKRFTPSVLAGIASQFMVPDYQTQGIIEIPNGWSTRRGRFIMTLSIRLATGSRLRQVVMGFTNSVGFTTRNVDHDMDFYVNNSFMLVERREQTKDGRYETYWKPQGCVDILSDGDNSGHRRVGPELFTMRPEDVYSAIDLDAQLHVVDLLVDTRLQLSKNAVTSSSGNRLSHQFMSKVLDSRHKAIKANDYGRPSIELNATAQGYAAETYASDNVFLAQMANIRGSTAVTDHFTFRDLIHFDRDVERKTETMLLKENDRAITNFGNEDINDLAGQEEEDRVAALIAIAVPALMVEHGIHNISFDVDNQGPRGEWFFTPKNARSLVKDMDISEFVEDFGDRLIDELLTPITGGNQYDIALKLHCRAFGEVDFSMHWDGLNRGRYVIPVFTNAKASPIVTTNRDQVLKMSKDFNDLFEEFLPANAVDSTGGDYNY